MEDSRPDATPPSNWRLVLGVVPILLGLFLYRLLAPAAGEPAAGTPGPPTDAAPVAIRIEQPDAGPTELSVPWSEAQTVAQATQQADLEAVWRGSGEMAFLESLVGIPNQGGDGLNWQFEVNGDYAEQGAGAVTLQPGDRVLWKLAPYE